MSHTAITTGPVDAEARLAALDPTHSFAVTAPAGSGKTGLLTLRVLTLLQRVEHPEEVLAITFTNKAASEMQTRILDALHEAATEPRPEDAHRAMSWDLAHAVLARDKEQNWQLLHNPSRLRIQTIDGLCRRIALQLPFSSTLGAMPQTLEDAEGAYREAAQNLLLKLDTDALCQAPLAQLLTHLDNHLPAIESLFVALLQKREQWLRLIFAARQTEARQWLEQTQQQLVEEHLQALRQTLGLFASELCGLMDQAAANLATEKPDAPQAALIGIADLPPAQLDALPRWHLLSQFLLTKSNTYRARLTVAEGFPGGKDGKPLKDRFTALTHELREYQPSLEADLAAVQALPNGHYNEAEWQLLSALTQLLPRLVAELRVVFQSKGATDFTEITQAALEALGDPDTPTDLALKLDYRIRHILVDEFQDTAQPQLELLKRLTAGWEPDDGRTLFIVGDGMQSCYGFRNANVGLFLDARRQGIGNVPLIPADLSVNFRSESGIVDWVNRVFAGAFPAADDISRGAVRYTPSVAHKDPGPVPAVSVHAVLYSTDSEDPALPDKAGARRSEAAALVEWVREAQVRDPDGSIAILGRNRAHLAEVMAALNAAAIPFQANAMDALSSRMPIADLLSLTRALLKPDDRIAWLAIMRAPWCGLDLHDLYRLANHAPEPAGGRNPPLLWQNLDDVEKLAGLSEPGLMILRRVAAILNRALSERQRKPLASWLRGTWLALGGPACLHTSSDHADVAQFFALLEKHDRAGTISDWEAFHRAVSKLYAAPMANADPRLQVMTVHKSKGLEFDTVMIPGLDRGSRGQDKALLLWREWLSGSGQPKLMLGPLARTGDDPGKLYQYLKAEQKRQDDYEATRLLYVGCTRAIKRLYLSASMAVKDDLPIAELNPPGLLKTIWPGVRDTITPLATPVAARQTAHAIDGNHGPALVRLPATWVLPALEDNTALQGLRGRASLADDEDNIPSFESDAARLLRHTGTVIHRVLENLAQAILPDDSEVYIASQQKRWHNYLRQTHIAGPQIELALARISEAVRQTLADPDGRWLLDCRHPDAHTEMVFTLPGSDGQFRQKIVDRVLVADGIRWVIDYKSAEPDTLETRDEFIAREIAAYQAQLVGYRQLFASRAEPLTTALYFPLLRGHPRLIPVEIPPQ